MVQRRPRLHRKQAQVRSDRQRHPRGEPGHRRGRGDGTRRHPALRLQTGQLAGYQAQSTRAIVEALDAQTRFQAQIAREVEESEEVRARRPTRASCRLVTGATGLAGARAGEAEALRRAAMIESGRIAGDRRFFDPGGAAADSEARFSRLTGTWCNAERSGQVACQGHEHLHGADVRADTLFDTATFHDAATLEAAVELARNLASPLVHDQPALASATTPAERRRVLLGRSADARAALAADVFSRARALRAPAIDLGAWAEAVLPGGTAREAGPLSRHELLEILASSRFDDPEWFLLSRKSPPPGSCARSPACSPSTSWSTGSGFAWKNARRRCWPFLSPQRRKPCAASTTWAAPRQGSTDPCDAASPCLACRRTRALDDPHGPRALRHGRRGLRPDHGSRSLLG